MGVFHSAADHLLKAIQSTASAVVATASPTYSSQYTYLHAVVSHVTYANDGLRNRTWGPKRGVKNAFLGKMCPFKFYIKDRVFARKVEDIEELKRRIRDVI